MVVLIVIAVILLVIVVTIIGLYLFCLREFFSFMKESRLNMYTEQDLAAKESKQQLESVGHTEGDFLVKKEADTYVKE